MAVWNDVRLSGLVGAFRLDAEFWQPAYVSVENKIARLPHDSLGNVIISLRKGVFNILAESYVDDGVPFYRSSNVGQIFPKESNLAFITQERHLAESKTALKRGDIMLAKTGKEAASVVLCDECNVSQDVIAARVDHEKVNPSYLAVFLNTYYGQSQMRRWFQGRVQFHLSLPDARQILVPLPSENFQHNIEHLLHQAEVALSKAFRCASEAESILSSALGLDKLDLTSKLSYQRSFSDILAAQRFDAEYFSPRYQQALRSLAKDNLTIGGVCSPITRKFQPLKLKGEDHFGYVEIGSLTRDGQAEVEDIRVVDAPSRAKWIASPGDVITSTVRPIRRLTAIISEEQDGVVCSSGFVVLRAIPDMIEPEVLLTYLRLPIVCEILDLHTTASMYPAIPMDKLLKIPISLPTESVRQQVVTRVRESFQARWDARRILGVATESVEMLIQSGHE